MRAPIEARKDVRKLIEEARNIYTDSDKLAEYIQDIVEIYSYKNDYEAHIQLYEDVRVMTEAYEMAKSLSGYDSETDTFTIQWQNDKELSMPLHFDKSFINDMWGIAEALYYLFYITAKLSVMLSPEDITRLPLQQVKRRGGTALFDDACKFYGVTFSPPEKAVSWEKLEASDDVEDKQIKELFTEKNFNKFVGCCYENGYIKGTKEVVDNFFCFIINKKKIHDERLGKMVARFLTRWEMAFRTERTIERYINKR
jgi:hypothetical protein